MPHADRPPRKPTKHALASMLNNEAQMQTNSARMLERMANDAEQLAMGMFAIRFRTLAGASTYVAGELFAMHREIAG